MAMLVLTWLDLLRLEQVAGRDIEPTGNPFLPTDRKRLGSSPYCHSRQVDTKNALAPGLRQAMLR